MKYIFLFFSFIFLHFPTISQRSVTIAIINENIGEDSEIDWFQQKTKEEIEVLLHNRYTVSFKEYYASYQESDVLDFIDEVYVDPDVDIVLGIGGMTGGIISARSYFPKPTIAGVIVDNDLQNVPLTPSGSSGIHNFTYIQSPFDFTRDLHVLYRLRPFEKLAVLADNNITSYLPYLDRLLANIVEKYRAESIVIPYKGSVDATIHAIDNDVDAVYLLPIFDEMKTDELKSLLQRINERGLPSMAMLGELLVEQGALMGYEYSKNFGGNKCI